MIGIKCDDFGVEQLPLRVRQRPVRGAVRAVTTAPYDERSLVSSFLCCAPRSRCLAAQQSFHGADLFDGLTAGVHGMRACVVASWGVQCADAFHAYSERYLKI